MTLAGAHVRMIGEGLIGKEVWGVAANADFIAATTEVKVFVFRTDNGDLIRSLGGEGQLSGCNGIRFTPSGRHIVVAESINDRLSEFDVDTGEPVRHFGFGDSRGHPYDVEFSSNGEIVVSEQTKTSCSICVFSSDGSCLRSFGGSGSSPGMFKFPIALAVHGDKLFVLDGTRVHVFN